MIVTFYRNLSDDLVINKNLERVGDVMFNFKTTRVDVVNPVLVLSKSQVNDECNYCYIDGLKRYYFIEESEVVSSKLVRLSLGVDVLETYKDKILTQECTIQVAAKKGLYGEVELATTGRVLTSKVESDVELTPAKTVLMSTVGV